MKGGVVQMGITGVHRGYWGELQKRKNLANTLMNFRVPTEYWEII